MLFIAVEPALATARDLHADMEQELAKQKLAGMVRVTVNADGIDRIDAAGLKNAQTGEPMTSDSRVQVGSVAKTALAVGVLRLVTENRLTLDTPVAELLTNRTFLNRRETSEPVRVRHLLAHTAGLDNARFGQVFSLQARPNTQLADVFADDAELLAPVTAASNALDGPDRLEPAAAQAVEPLGCGLRCVQLVRSLDR